jgi:hypothetical protein
VLQHLLRVCVLPFTVCVFCIKVIFGKRWYEWSAHPFFNERLPVKTVEPLVLFENLRPFLTETVSRLALDEPVDKVSGLD